MAYEYGCTYFFSAYKLMRFQSIRALHEILVNKGFTKISGKKIKIT